PLEDVVTARLGTDEYPVTVASATLDGGAAGWKLSLSVPPGEAAGWKSLVLIRADGSEIVISQAFRYNEPGRIEDWAMGQAGLSDSAALRSDGTIVYWGSVPWLTSVPSGNGFTKISLSTSHGSALKSSGEIVEWGNNW